MRRRVPLWVIVLVILIALALILQLAWPLVADLLDRPHEPDEFARSLFDASPVRLVCVTLGGEGCLAVTPEETVRVRPEPVVVADTVGAGDAFTAGLIYARLHASQFAGAALQG